MKYILVFVAALFALGLQLSDIQAAATGSIQGRVLNGTNDGSAASGVAVTLHGLGPEGALTTVKATTDASGAFSFPELTLGESYVYRVAATYLDVAYTSGEVRLTAESPANEVELKVYELTNSDAAILARMDHLIIDVDPEARLVWVLEYLKLENTGNKTFVGSEGAAPADPRPTLRFSLQPDVTQISIMEGLDAAQAIEWEGGFADTSPVPPGSRDVTISYSIPYTAKNLTLRKTVVYPTEKTAVLLPGSLKARSDALPNVRNETIEDVTYVVLSGDRIGPNSVVEIRLEGLPFSGGSSGPSRVLIGAAAVAMAVALVVAALYTRRRLAPAPAAVAGTDERAALVATLAELDETFEEGKIGQEEYQRLRDAAKSRLRSVW